MRTLTMSEVQDVNGGTDSYSIGYTIGSWIRGAFELIGSTRSGYDEDRGAGAWG